MSGQKLEVFQSLWAMERRRPDKLEWSLEEKFDKVAVAGYDGMAIDLADADIPAMKQCVPLFARTGLKSSVTAFPTSIDDLKPVLELASECNAEFITLNGKLFPFSPQEGAEYIHGWLALGREAGIPCYIETHRLTITTDMLYTLQLMDLVPEMEMIADVSHFVVAREFPEPVDELHEHWMDKVLRRSAGFQGRVASREQVQVQLEFPQQQYWVEKFFSWWEQGFKHWRSRKPKDATLNFLCELGPPPYAITGADGYELSDRWEEALLIKDRVQTVWAGLR